MVEDRERDAAVSGTAVSWMKKIMGEGRNIYIWNK